MSHLTLDARAILAYLNELGYRNISAEQLREFMKDLRKLIKYEERLGTNANKDDYFDSLFQRTTASFRAKQDKENVAANMKGKGGKKKSALEEKTLALEQKKSALDQKKSALEQKTLALEQKKSALDQKKSALEEQKKYDLEQKKSTLEQKNVSEQKKQTKKLAIASSPASLPQPPPPPAPMKPMQGSTSSCHANKVMPCDCPSTVGVAQRKVLSELPLCPTREPNRRELKKPNNFFCIDDDDNAMKSNKKKQTELLFINESAKKGHSSRSKSPKSAKAGLTGKLLDDLKQPLWEGHSVSSRSRSHSTGRNRPEPSAKALSTGGIHKQRRSQSSDRPSDFRTYTARSLGAMVPQPRFNRGDRSGVNDPVKLYHYYQREWKYFEKQIPGVLTRADIRWQIRQKLLDPQ